MEYEIRRNTYETIDELKELVELQNITYANRNLKFSTDFFHHWYLNNPSGKVISFNAYYNNKLVAHYACIPVKLNIDNKIVNGIHSMATVTHPDHRGKGLFKKLATLTYDFAKKNNFKFVLGVANANSYPGFIKYFSFVDIDRLMIKWGFGRINYSSQSFKFSKYWDQDLINWRIKGKGYFKKKNMLFSTYNKIPFIKLIMGFIPSIIELNCSKIMFYPFNLYIGLNADLSKGHYFSLPKFIKHSPFHLIFLDLTDGELPTPTKDNFFFQLIDFDVA